MLWSARNEKLVDICPTSALNVASSDERFVKTFYIIPSVSLVIIVKINHLRM